MSKPVGNIVNEINLGKGAPTSILYDPKNGYTYVAITSWNYSGIYVIANYTEVSEIPTLLPPSIMCYNPQNGDVYVDLGSLISVINGTTIVGNIALNGQISTMLYDRLNGILYAYVNSYTNNYTIGAIYAINVSNNTIIGHVSIGNSSSLHMLLNPSNGYIYVSLTNGSIIVLTPYLDIIGTINVNTFVISMLYDPVNGYIYVDGVGELVVINPSDNSVIGFIRVFGFDFYLLSEPVLTYNPSNGYVYVVDGNYIGVISSNNLVAEIPIGSLTFAVTYSPENNYVYVSANGMISVIDPEYDFVISNLTAPNDLWYSLMTYGNGYIYDADYLTNYTTQVIIIGLQSAQKEGGLLIVNVYNYTPGFPVVGGITYGLLINSENQVVEKAYINSYSQLVFTNVTPGQYVVDVYHIPSSGMNITEYWGNITVNVTSLPYTVNFIRNAPVIYSLNYFIANGRYNISAVIYNPRNYSIEATVYFYTPSSLIPASIERYLAPGYNYFSLGIPSSTPYVDVVVSAYLSNYLGTPIPTDEKVLRFVTETSIEQCVILPQHLPYNLIPYFYNSSAMGAVYLNFTQAELGLFMPPVMLGNLSIPGILDFNNMSYFVHTLEGPYVFSTILGGWNVYGFTFVALPTYGNGSVVNSTYMLQKTMIIAYNGEKVIVLLYYRNLAPVPLELNQYWSHIHKGVDGLSFAVYPDLFNPYVNATEQVIQDAYYIDGNTSLYVNGSYLGQLNSFGLWQVLPVGPITLINNASGWDIQLIPINNLSTTQQIQLVTNGFSIDNVTIANSFFNIQHAEITLLPNQSAQYVYSIGINTQPPNYTEISGILSYLIQIASSSVPHNTSSTLIVTVYNVNGKLASSLPGVVYGILVNDQTGQQVAKAFMNNESLLVFNGIPQGNYTLFVYHYPNIGLNFTEFWGIENVSVLPGKTVYLNFTRYEPWIYDVNSIPLLNGSVIISVEVYNPLSDTVMGEIDIYENASSQPNSGALIITRQEIISPGLNKFSFIYTPNTGEFYLYTVLKVNLTVLHVTSFYVTDQYNWTLFASLNGPITVYVPVWFNGTTYYVYWDINGVPSKSIKIGLDPYSFLDLVLRLNSSRGPSADIIFSGITYQNNTPLTNTSMEELILEYLYLWLLIGGKLSTVVQNYGINSPGYQFINITIQSGIPTVIEVANGITNVMYYLLDFVEVIKSLVVGSSKISLTAKATVAFFKLLKLFLTHKLQDEFGNQEAQEIEELFKQYHLQASNYLELLQEFSSLPPSEQENFIASWYEITTGQTLPNLTLRAIDVLINKLIGEVASFFVERYTDSLYKALISEGVKQNFALKVLQKFINELLGETSDSIVSTSSTASTSQALASSAEEDVGLEAFLLLTIASIIENAWNIPAEIVFSEILEYINLLNYNYGYIENYINEYETSSVANLTLASQLYFAMILNNLWWSILWHKFYTIPWFYHNNNYLSWSQGDNINAVDMIITLSNLMGDASFTLKWGHIPLVFIFDQNIYTPIVPQYSPFSNFFLRGLISLKDFFTSVGNEIASAVNNIANAIWTIIKVFGDPPLVVINVNSTYILLNGTTINTTNPFAFISYQNNTYSVVLPISNITYLGLESNETTQITISPVTNKTTIANLTLSPYNAEILRVKGLNVSIMNTTTTINTQGMILLTGNNNLSFVWLSNGNLVVKGLPPGQYVVHKLVTNTTIQQISVSSLNTTEITQIPVGPSAPIVQSNNNNFNMLPILVLVILVVVLAVIITLYKRLK
jgi:hypothetical protein